LALSFRRARTERVADRLGRRVRQLCDAMADATVGQPLNRRSLVCASQARRLAAGLAVSRIGWIARTAQHQELTSRMRDCIKTL